MDVSRATDASKYGCSSSHVGWMGGKGREYTGVAWREEHASRWGEEEHARRWRREKYPCHRREKHIIRSEEGDNSEQRVPIRPRSLGCGPPSFREGASFRKRISINVSRPLLVIE